MKENPVGRAVHRFQKNVEASKAADSRKSPNRTALKGPNISFPILRVNPPKVDLVRFLRDTNNGIGPMEILVTIRGLIIARIGFFLGLSTVAGIRWPDLFSQESVPTIAPLKNTSLNRNPIL